MHSICMRSNHVECLQVTQADLRVNDERMWTAFIVHSRIRSASHAKHAVVERLHARAASVLEEVDERSARFKLWMGGVVC